MKINRITLEPRVRGVAGVRLTVEGDDAGFQDWLPGPMDTGTVASLLGGFIRGQWEDRLDAVRAKRRRKQAACGHQDMIQTGDWDKTCRTCGLLIRGYDWADWPPPLGTQARALVDEHLKNSREPGAALEALRKIREEPPLLGRRARARGVAILKNSPCPKLEIRDIDDDPLIIELYPNGQIGFDATNVGAATSIVITPEQFEQIAAFIASKGKP